MFKSIFLISILSFFFVSLSDDLKAAYFSADLKEAINIECKKSVKDKKYSNKKECSKALKAALEAQGVVSVQQVPDIDRQEYIEDICVFDIKLGALNYNKCIYEAINKELGIETVEPPVLVKNQVESGNDEDEEAPPIEIPMPKNIINDVYNNVKDTTFYVAFYLYNEDEESWDPNGTGSAVHIGDGMLVTNCHVVTLLCDVIFPDKNSPENNACSKIKTAIDIISINEDASEINSDKWFRDLEIIKEDQISDRCIINTEDNNFKYPSAEIKYFNELKIHDTVYAIGSPRRFTGKPTEGKITMLYNNIPPGLHEVTNFQMQGVKMKYIETDAPVDKGNSGGGLFSSDGKLIGVPSLCDIIGGPEQCVDIDGEKNSQTYCNLSSPQNWSIPIDMFLDIM